MPLLNNISTGVQHKNYGKQINLIIYIWYSFVQFLTSFFTVVNVVTLATPENSIYYNEMIIHKIETSDTLFLRSRNPINIAVKENSMTRKFSMAWSLHFKYKYELPFTSSVCHNIVIGAGNPFSVKVKVLLRNKGHLKFFIVKNTISVNVCLHPQVLCLFNT